MKNQLITIALISLICSGLYSYAEFIHIDNHKLKRTEYFENENNSKELTIYRSINRCGPVYNKSNFVIRNQSEWDKYNCQSIDFEKYVVIGVSMGMCSTGGYHIEIIKIEEREKNIRVKVKTRSPAPGEAVTLATTLPTHVVIIEKNDKPVEFIYENYVGDGIFNGIDDKSKNIAPIADAGENITQWINMMPGPDIPRYPTDVTMVNNVNQELNASRSYDPDGEIINWTWIIKSEYCEDTILFGEVVKYQGCAPANVTLIVTDNKGKQAKDTINITIEICV